MVRLITSPACNRTMAARPMARGQPQANEVPLQVAQHGKSGLWISDVLPHLAEHADHLCLLNSMYTDVGVHPQAVMQMHTGTFRFQRLMGAGYCTG